MNSKAFIQYIIEGEPQFFRRTRCHSSSLHYSNLCSCSGTVKCSSLWGVVTNEFLHLLLPEDSPNTAMNTSGRFPTDPQAIYTAESISLCRNSKFSVCSFCCFLLVCLILVILEFSRCISGSTTSKTGMWNNQCSSSSPHTFTTSLHTTAIPFMNSFDASFFTDNWSGRDCINYVRCFIFNYQFIGIWLEIKGFHWC